MIAFAWPGIIGGLAFYALNLLDRFFVKHYHGLADTGLYGAAFRYSQVVVVAVLAFRMGWTPVALPLAPQRAPPADGRPAAPTTTSSRPASSPSLVSAWILPVFHLLMPERYWDATTLSRRSRSPPSRPARYTLFAVGLNVTKRMRLLLPLAVLRRRLAVGLYFLLIPPFSFVGAAWATAAAFTALALARARRLATGSTRCPGTGAASASRSASRSPLPRCARRRRLGPGSRLDGRPRRPSRSPTRSSSSRSASSRPATSRPCATACACAVPRSSPPATSGVRPWTCPLRAGQEGTNRLQEPNGRSDATRPGPAGAVPRGPCPGSDPGRVRSGQCYSDLVKTSIF